MKTIIITNENREDNLIETTDYLENNKDVIVNITTFFDSVSELWTTVFHYYL